MDAPKGISLVSCLGTTNRGTLWRAVHESGRPRIVRLLDQELGDQRFKETLAAIAGRERPRMAPVVGHGYSGRHYYIEYAVDKGCRTWEERWEAAPDWRSRLLLVHQVCEVFPQWVDGALRPLGVTSRDVLMTLVGNGWHPWLLPCPPVSVPPRARRDVDRHVLATLAPEALRGVHADPAAQDAYALGTLAAQAAGCSPDDAGPDDAVTDQARNALLRADPRSSAIPSYLVGSPAVVELFQVIRRHRHWEPEVRPVAGTGLADAILGVADLERLAAGLEEPASAREVLCLLRPEDGAAFVRGMIGAAEMSLELGEPDRARTLIERTIGLRVDRALARRRADVLWRLVEPDEVLQPTDPLVRATLDALDEVKKDPEPRYEAFLRSGHVHWRCAAYEAAATAFFSADQLRKDDPEPVWMYWRCWKSLGGISEAEATEKEARRRIDRMVEAGMMSRWEGRRWHDRFE